MVCEKYSNFIPDKNRTRELDLYPGNNISKDTESTEDVVAGFVHVSFCFIILKRG